MLAVQKIKQFFNVGETDPESAYDLWAASYDSQPDNLMLALDEEVFSTLLNNVPVKDKTIIDIGCGTGRHWKKILNREPAAITGFDVSEKMLQLLKQKFPQAETHQLKENRLNGLANSSCDVVVSTLTIAHIKNAREALKEWTRVVKPGGNIIITDYHPAALAKGSNRTFKYGDKTVAIINHVHPLKRILTIAGELDLKAVQLIEKNIDDSVKAYYEKQNAIAVFDKWKNTPIIYGLRLKKADDII